jgi:hypothetical protein
VESTCHTYSGLSGLFGELEHLNEVKMSRLGGVEGALTFRDGQNFSGRPELLLQKNNRFIMCDGSKTVSG